jgi:hypothetical protein
MAPWLSGAQTAVGRTRTLRFPTLPVGPAATVDAGRSSAWPIRFPQSLRIQDKVRIPDAPSPAAPSEPRSVEPCSVYPVPLLGRSSARFSGERRGHERRTSSCCDGHGRTRTPGCPSCWWPCWFLQPAEPPKVEAKPGAATALRDAEPPAANKTVTRALLVSAA